MFTATIGGDGLSRETKNKVVASGYGKTQPLHEINIGAVRDEHCANIGNKVRIREVEPLRDRNVGDVIHEERKVNIIRIREVLPTLFI
ncbi:hypothetical protein RHMOL_Rhmol10G0082500 [Rhododendron molle]|uniref:Uncharacterized protein n=1 Tax=Rhododendron molle TaxID=49168 RepID=A0ACC0M1C0_RHOML|nr:hypothetical protein RHMOL_Rhmol10G0082500 [Rhododendron molle]